MSLYTIGVSSNFMEALIIQVRHRFSCLSLLSQSSRYIMFHASHAFCWPSLSYVVAYRSLVASVSESASQRASRRMSDGDGDDDDDDGE